MTQGTPGRALRTTRATNAALLLVALVVSTVAPSAYGDFLDSYKRGLEKMEGQEWSQAAQWMRKAIEDRSEESPRLPARFYFQPYIPHYHLGIAYYQLNDCRKAIGSWVESERQGVIVKRDEFAVIAQRRRICDRRMKLHGQALGAAEQQLNQATAAFRELAALTNAPDLAALWSSGDPSVAERQRMAERLLSESGQRIDTARQRAEAVDRLESGGRQADAARTVFETILQEVEAFRVSRTKRLRSEGQKLQKTITAAKRLLAQGLGPASSSPLARRRQGELRGRLEKAQEAQGASSDLTEDQLKKLESQLSRTVNGLRQAKATPPTPLLEAADAWFQADANRVIEILTDAQLRGRKTKAHAHLLLAAAHFSLSRTGEIITVQEGEPEEDEVRDDDPNTDGDHLPLDHLTAARNHVAACQEADSRLEPIQAAFSPAFRTFFAEATQGEDPAANDPAE